MAQLAASSILVSSGEPVSWRVQAPPRQRASIGVQSSRRSAFGRGSRGGARTHCGSWGWRKRTERQPKGH
eukprot:6962633-Lingulodinium_polyedra.AAC.1